MRTYSGRLKPSCALLVIVALVTGLIVPPGATAYLTDTASHPPPSSGTYAYDTFGPGAPGFPAVGQDYVDPVFNETIRRLTDETSFAEFGASEIYSKNGYFNADNTLMYHRRPDGRNIIDANTGAVVCANLPLSGTVGADSSFDPVDPTSWYYFSGTALRRFIVTGGSCSQDPNPVKVFPGTLGSLGGSVDWIDSSGRYMVLNIGGLIYVWDRQLDQLYGNPFDYNAYSANGDGWVGISPDGKYLITAGAGPTHYSFAIDHVGKTLGSPVLFWTLCGGHADIVSASDGKTYYVSFDCNTTGDIYRVDVSIPQSAANVSKQLADNVKIVDLDTTTAAGWSDVDGHFSGVSKGPLKDWVYVSIESGDDPFNGGVSPWRRYKSEIFMVNVITQEIRRLAHHRSRSLRDANTYIRQPRVSASWDGGKVAWASNFNLNNGFDYADIYSITVPTGGGGGGDTTPPTVSITAPASNATVSGTLTITATANDNVGVAGVQFKVDNTNIGAEDTAAPYSVSWNSTAVPDGTHTLKAVARDAAGNTSTASITVIVSNGGGGGGDTTPPTVSITSPPNGAWTGGSIEVFATANDNVGLRDIKLWGNGSVFGTITCSGASCSGSIWWVTGSLAPAAYQVQAVATDTSGNQTISAPVTINKDATSPIVPSGAGGGGGGGGDTTPPTVSITSPPNGAWTGGSIEVSAAANDNVGLRDIKLWGNGSVFGTITCSGTSCTGSIWWVTGSLAPAAYQVQAVATDTSGNQTISAPVTINKDATSPIVPSGAGGGGGGGDTTPPTVSITSPPDGAWTGGSIEVFASAGDNVGLTDIKLWGNGSVFGTITCSGTSCSGSIWWVTGSLAPAAYQVQAVATDTSGNRRTSAAVTINKDATSPTVPSGAP